MSGCDQLVVDPTQARVGALELLLTDVPDLVWVAVVAPIGNYDQLSFQWLSCCQLVASRKMFLKHKVNWNTVCCGSIQNLPWRNIWSADNPVEVLNYHLSLRIN